MNLDTTEAKGPFILAISQPLEYSFDITSQIDLLNRGTPITGLQLKAIVDQIDIKATLIIVFGGGLNIFRHSVINSIGFTEVKPQKSEESIAKDAKEQALAEEKHGSMPIKITLKNCNHKEVKRKYFVLLN